MLDADWPRQEAETALASLTAQKGKAEAEPNGAPAPSPLAPSPETLSKLQSQLRLSKQQAKRSWENLLYAVAVEQGAKAADEDGDMEASAQAVAAVEGLVAGSIEAQVANAKKGSEGKAVTETDSGFVMAKTKRGVKPSGAGYVPVEGASAEQQREAIQKAVAVRVEEMRRLVGLRNEGEDDEEGQA